MKYWLFQGSPKYYRLQDSIRDSEQMAWLVTRYVNEMVVGDGVLIWQAGEKAGIYATAEIIEQPKMVDKQPDIDYWLDKSRLGSLQYFSAYFLHTLKPLICGFYPSPTLRTGCLSNCID